MVLLLFFGVRNRWKTGDNLVAYREPSVKNPLAVP
jgi:hypothetical protein